MDAAEQLPDLPGELPLRVVAIDEFAVPADKNDGAWLEVDDEGEPFVRWEVKPEPDVSLEEITRGNLRGTVFHELHHISRDWPLENLEEPVRLVDVVVSEGLATAFARDAAGYVPNYADYPDDVDVWMRELLQDGSMDDYGDWMFQHPDGRRWIAYRVGTWVVDQAVDASGRSAADLVHASAEEVFDLARLELEAHSEEVTMGDGRRLSAS